MQHTALLAGIGKMGRNHAKAVMSDKTSHIKLAGVCDCNIDNLIAFRQENPEIPVFLTPKECNPSDDDLSRALDNEIDIYYSIADLVHDIGANTLINATHNESHMVILRQALQAENQGQPMILTVFQEKPFGDIGEDISDVEALIKKRNITFNLNGILTFSPIWNNFNDLVVSAESEGFEVSRVYCAYGKDRTKDTRPAPGGWVGMDCIHALDISTQAGLSDLTIDEKDVKNKRGHLAEVAGNVNYETKFVATMKNKQGNDVSMRLEGSFAWEKDHRHVQYMLKNDAGETITLQVDFDVLENEKRIDVIHAVRRNTSGQAMGPMVRMISNADKLTGYYQSVLDKKDRRAIYGLDRAMNVQAKLRQISGVESAEISRDFCLKKPMFKEDLMSLHKIETVRFPKSLEMRFNL